MRLSGDQVRHAGLASRDHHVIVHLKPKYRREVVPEVPVDGISGTIVTGKGHVSKSGMRSSRLIHASWGRYLDNSANPHLDEFVG